MIKITQSRSAEAAKQYFTSLVKSDYYMADGQEHPGFYHGKLAERLGLNGEVTKDAFYALCDNINPVTLENLTPKTKIERTVGYDLTFLCPKSVSIVNALSKDGHIQDAFMESVHATMLEVEQDIQTRVRLHGQDMDRNTNELLYIPFVHQTARPVDNHVPDPLLHAHVYTFNVAYDPVERRTKAGQFREIKRNAIYYQKLFHKHLSDRLIDLGYDIERTKDAFEIKGVPKTAITMFSKRQTQVLKEAYKRGITDKKKISDLAALSRSKKQKDLTMDELKADWRRQIEEANIKDDPKAPKLRFAQTKEKDLIDVSNCIDHAIKHSFERTSVKNDRRVLAEALTHSIGVKSVGIEQVKESYRHDTRLIRVHEQGVLKCTTVDVLAEEKWMVDLAKSGVDKRTPLYKQCPDLDNSLDPQQRAAIEHVLTSSNMVSIIRGGAGTGKTTLMREAVKWFQKGSKSVMTVAPTSEASRGVLKKEGFKDATTVAALLTDKKLQQKLKNDVLWVDEAGLLSNKEAIGILALAKECNARIVFAGDTRQHNSVDRGDALRILNTVGKIDVAEVDKIYRQKKYHYREAIGKIANGDIADGFSDLNKLGYIRSLDNNEIPKQIAADYLTALKSGKSALVISPTHHQKNLVTKAIRQEMKAAKMISGVERTYDRYHNLNLTEAEKADYRNLSVGQFIQFNLNTKGAKRGTTWKIDGIQDMYIRLKDSNGKTCSLPIHKPKSYDVMERRQIELAKGDKVRITRNAYKKDVVVKEATPLGGLRKAKQPDRLNNGQVMEVVAVKKDSILLRNDKSKIRYEIPKEFGHIDHAHVVTSYASQGKTVDRVFVAQPSSTFEATNSKQFYVSASRAREKVTFYTDDKSELLKHVSDFGDRQSAIEIVKGHDAHAEHMAIKHREDIDRKPDKQDVEKSRNAHFENKLYEPRL